MMQLVYKQWCTIVWPAFYKTLEGAEEADRLSGGRDS